MRFAYLDPKNLEETLGLLAEYRERAKLLAGGTDLFPQIIEKRLTPEVVINLGNNLNMDYIIISEKEGLKIGALTPVRSIEKGEALLNSYTALYQGAKSIGSPAIRNVATLGGNLCNAAPCADTAPALIAFSATLKILSLNKERIVPLEDFFLGPGLTVLQDNEMVSEIQVPALESNTRSIYLKHSRSSVDLALVSVAASLVLERSEKSEEGSLLCRGAKIVFGSVAPTPIRARKAEAILEGQYLNPSIIKESARVAKTEVKPISDVRAEAEYRREITEFLTHKALQELTIKNCSEGGGRR